MNAPTVGTIIDPNLSGGYEVMLKESIKFFLAELHRGGSDFTAFQLIFYRLLQTKTDTPLGILWFYLAVSYHSFKSIPQGPSKKFLVSKDLFQSISSYSTQCNALKRVAVLAPVLYVVHNSVIDLTKSDLCLGEIDNLVEIFVSYISMCCASEEQEDELDELTPSFLDLLRIWTMDQVGDSGELVDYLRVFFPLLSDEVRLKINLGYRMVYLAGVVMNEIILLRLHLKLRLGVWGESLWRDMADWAVQSINGFQNIIFFDLLLRMMLEPSLPVTTLLSSGEEVFLRKVLYDAVILGDFPFLKCARSTQLPENHLKNLSLAWLLVVDNAIKFVREYGEPAAATFFIDGYSKSDIPNLLIQWVSTQTGMEEKLGRPDMSTPKALIKWLLVLEDQGIRVFEEDFLKSHAKAAICKSRVDYARPGLMPAGDTTFSDIGIREEQKMDKSTVTHGRRKREEEMNEEAKRTRIAECDFQECHPFTENSLPLDALIRDDGDENMEDLG